MSDAKQIQKWYRDSREESAAWRKEARLLYDLKAGNQWTKVEQAEFIGASRTPIVMNRVGPYIDAIIGQQINNRQELSFLPRQTADTQIADIYAEVVRWCDDDCNAEDEITDSFEDMVITGMGWTETRMDYAIDPEGRLRTAERIDPMEMYWSPTATRRNLSDASYVIRTRKYPRSHAEKRWPKITQASVNSADDEGASTEPHDATNAWRYEGGTGSGYNIRDNTYFVLQCQYYRDESATLVIDPETGQNVVLPEGRAQKLKPMLQAMGIQMMQTTKRKFYQCWVCGETLLQEEEGPSQKGFTLRAMTAKRDRNSRSWYGVCRALSDPQKFSNKFFSDIMYIIATNRKGGAFAETGAFVDPRKAKEIWSDPAALIELNSGGLEKIRERDAGIYPTGLDRLMQYAIDAVPATSGLNPELIGMADRAQAGVLEAQRKQAGLTILAPMFDPLKRHARERGIVVLDMMRRYMSDGRMLRITDQQGNPQIIELLQVPDDMEFDIVVDTMPTTPNAKAQTFEVLAQLVPFMAKLGIAPPPDVLDYMPLPATLVQKWKEMLQPKEGGEDQPDPEAQKAMAQMQIKQIEMQAKQQSEQMRAQLEGQKAMIAADQAEKDRQIETQKTALELQQAQQEQALNARVKDSELELERRRLIIDAAKAETERAKVEAEIRVKLAEMQMTNETSQKEGANRDTMFREMVAAIQSITTTNADSMTKLLEQMATVAEAVEAEREVVRDERGRATGSRRKRQTMQ